MTQTLSSNTDAFLPDGIDPMVIMADIDGTEGENACQKSDSIDCRRRLEARIAERQLEKDLREFDFDL